MDTWLLPALLTIIGLTAAGLLLTYVPAVLVKQRQKADLARRMRGRLALTYDDGPDAQLTTELVKLLERYGARASFYLVGFRAVRSPAMAELLKTAGHEIGCHTLWHRKPWRVRPWIAVRDVNEGYRAMEKWMASNAAFRPPFGKMTTWTWLAARRRGAPIAWWTHDGGDTHPTLPDPQSIVRQLEASDGGAVLLHSHDRRGPDAPQRHEYVLRITQALLEAARRHGWQVCTMRDVLAEAGATSRAREEAVAGPLAEHPAATTHSLTVATRETLDPQASAGAAGVQS